MEQLITILGPTAVGKTDLTLRLAEKLNGIVISGDATKFIKALILVQRNRLVKNSKRCRIV